MSYNTTKKEATREAKKLQKIFGKTWKIQVWENLGWPVRNVRCR